MQKRRKTGLFQFVQKMKELTCDNGKADLIDSRFKICIGDKTRNNVMLSFLVRKQNNLKIPACVLLPGPAELGKENGF